MSAFEVSSNHIRVMINAGLTRSLDGRLEWMVHPFTEDETETVFARGHAWGPGMIRVAQNIYRELNTQSAETVGAMLAAQNQRSVNFRYAEEEIEAVYQHGPTGSYSPVELLKIVKCYEYQSCETPDWETTEAHNFCAALKDQLIHLLPGYDEAPWAI
jgi:hypothetical protein